ncbi:MAG: hypothetical protein EOM54_10645 [Clostridia bacterium]|nr:hypothetical protein [Clostridia bacterium]
MKQKRISVRFDLDVDAEHRAWELLHETNASMNQTIIAAVNAFFEPVNPALKETIREVLRDCLHDVSLVKASQAEQATTISEDESALLDSLDDLLGD